MMAFSGSSTRKEITAFTLIDTLSRVMTSWGGTSMATVRRLTFTILSTNGIRRRRPGPRPSPPGLKTDRAFFPSRKMTPRSYSRRILTIELKKKSTAAAPPPGADPPRGAGGGLLKQRADTGRHGEGEEPRRRPHGRQDHPPRDP